ncbi:MAG: ribonuclease HII [Candidatus Marinimicrobia bacterium]|nr:ribonuclease HII [Candidatus Neomarinimicrobiota bacterium]
MGVGRPRLIAGIDEAGRGPLAGPVVAAAVILDPQRPIEGLRDSKKLTEKQRENLYDEIFEKARAVGVGQSQRREIDLINILNGTMAAMQRALDNLPLRPEHLQIDGQHITLEHSSQETIIKGDQKVPAISAASIVAKVTRDRIMAQYHKVYPQYGFDRHKGYGTKAHLAALAEHGACPIHRQSFRPVIEHLPRWADVKGRKELGRLGEQLAATHLIEQGYSIVDLNYNVVHTGEIDIIALQGEVLVFCEVKSQGRGQWGEPQEQVDFRKRDRIMAAAQQYTIEKGIDSEVRFDVISLKFTRAGPVINHLENCIYAD